MIPKIKNFDPKIQQVDLISKHSKSGSLAILLFAKPVPIAEREGYEKTMAAWDEFQRYNDAEGNLKFFREPFEFPETLRYSEYYPHRSAMRSFPFVSETLLGKFTQIAIRGWSSQEVTDFLNSHYGENNLAKVRCIRHFQVAQGAELLLGLLAEPQAKSRPTTELRQEILLAASELLETDAGRNHPIFSRTLRKVLDTLVGTPQAVIRKSNGILEEVDGFGEFLFDYKLMEKEGGGTYPDITPSPLLRAMVEGKPLEWGNVHYLFRPAVMRFINQTVQSGGFWLKENTGDLHWTPIHPEFEYVRYNPKPLQANPDPFHPGAEYWVQNSKGEIERVETQANAPDILFQTVRIEKEGTVPPEMAPTRLLWAMQGGLKLVLGSSSLQESPGVLDFLQKASASKGFWVRENGENLRWITIHPNFQVEIPKIKSQEIGAPQAKIVLGPIELTHVTVAKGATILNSRFAKETQVDSLKLEENYFARFDQAGKLVEVGKKK